MDAQLHTLISLDLRASTPADTTCRGCLALPHHVPSRETCLLQITTGCPPSASHDILRTQLSTRGTCFKFLPFYIGCYNLQTSTSPSDLSTPKFNRHTRES